MISTAHSRRTNNPTALAVEGASRGDDFAAFDALPATVRRAIAQQVTKLGCVSVLAYFRSIERQARQCGGSLLDAEIWTLRRLGQVETTELDAFAAAHKLPHAPADASVQRYLGSGLPRRSGARERRVHPAIRGLLVKEVAT